MSSATIRSEGLAGVFGRISKLPPDAISKLFPNVRALKGVLPALKNMEGFTEDIAVMADRAGATETAYKKMTGTLAHSFRQIKQSAIVALSVVGEALAEPVARIARTIKTYAAHVRRVLEKNKAMVVSAAKVVAVIGVVGGALIAVGVAGAAMSFVFGGIASIITGVGTAIGVLGSVLAALLSPIGLVTAGVVGLAVGILHATGAGVKALGWLGERFEALKQTALKAWQGIGDAMAAGNIALAAKILWLTLKLEWQRGVHALRGYRSRYTGGSSFTMSIGRDITALMDMAETNPSPSSYEDLVAAGSTFKSGTIESSEEQTTDRTVLFGDATICPPGTRYLILYLDNDDPTESVLCAGWSPGSGTEYSTDNFN